MVKRKEEDIVAQASIEVTLGGKPFAIPPLVICKAREWRKKVVSLIAPLPSLIKVTTDDGADFGKALSQILTTNSDKVIDLFFDYAKDLNRKEIERSATEAELAAAFEQILEVAFPLAASPMKILERLSQ